jgi:hypothetical protein
VQRDFLGVFVAAQLGAKAAPPRQVIGQDLTAVAVAFFHRVGGWGSCAMNPRRFSESQETKICRAYLGGCSLRHIAAQFSAPPSTVGNVLVRHGIRKDRKQTKRHQVIRLRTAKPNWSAERIAQVIGASPLYTMQIIVECGLLNAARAA